VSLVSTSLQYSNTYFSSSFEDIALERRNEVCAVSILNLVLRVDSSTSRSSAIDRSLSAVSRHQLIFSKISAVNF
jgi:hypothetical protein